MIRAWERRYKAIVPQRTGTNRRLCSDEEIHRLQLLRRATAAGHGIGQIAGLSDKDLEKIVENVEAACQEFQGEEIPSSVIGEKVMAELKTLDGVAYVRFASVYRQFRDVAEFMSELKDLLSKGKK